MSNRQPAVRVSDQDLRALFGHLRLWERRLANELLEVELVNRDPTPANKQPPGTRSIVSQLCRMDGLKRTVLAVVHYYRLPNGDINNAVKLPHPKWVLDDDGTAYSTR